jgi:hypothetical protein
VPRTGCLAPPLHLGCLAGASTGPRRGHTSPAARGTPAGAGWCCRCSHERPGPRQQPLIRPPWWLGWCRQRRTGATRLSKCKPCSARCIPHSMDGKQQRDGHRIGKVPHACSRCACDEEAVLHLCRNQVGAEVAVAPRSKNVPRVPIRSSLGKCFTRYRTSSRSYTCMATQQHGNTAAHVSGDSADRVFRTGRPWNRVPRTASTTPANTCKMVY